MAKGNRVKTKCYVLFFGLVVKNISCTDQVIASCHPHKDNFLGGSILKQSKVQIDLYKVVPTTTTTSRVWFFGRTQVLQLLYAVSQKERKPPFYNHYIHNLLATCACVSVSMCVHTLLTLFVLAS